MLAHQLHRLLRGDSPRVWKPLQQHAQPAEVIEMAVGDIDRGELAMVKCNPVGQRLSFGHAGSCLGDLAGGVALAKSCDVIVIGAGPAGLATAAALKTRGLNAAKYSEIQRRRRGLAAALRRLHLHTDRARSRPTGFGDTEGFRPLSLAGSRC